jgi:uncharacterized protein
MRSEENSALVRRGYEAFSGGDMTTLTELIAEDAVWHEEGHAGVSGVNQGRDAIFAHFGEEMSRSGGSNEVTLQDLIGGDGHLIALHHDRAERDNKVLDQNVVVIFHVRDGASGRCGRFPTTRPAAASSFPNPSA